MRKRKMDLLRKLLKDIPSTVEFSLSNRVRRDIVKGVGELAPTTTGNRKRKRRSAQ